MQKQKVYFKTFGCRTNLFDTQVMINALQDFTQTPYEEESDFVIVNSCAVTNGAESGARNYIHRLQNEGKRIYFTGCGVQTQGQNLLDKGLVFGVFGHSHKENINAILKQKQSFFLEDDLKSLDNKILGDFVGKSRAFIKIQEGCDFACSYCIIPSVRGKARSFPQEKIISQVEKLTQKGFDEFILTGTNIGSWGKEFGKDIANLIESLCAIPSLKRLRIGSLEPSQINTHFLEILQNPKIERHLHIALQHTAPAT
ncbi:radical SAM protein, partial [Helicobacter sp. UBA3407]|uniref:radical SAM protein n=1 Tax=Helicobacter TaxID=209 RepID=UPI00261981D2